MLHIIQLLKRTTVHRFYVPIFITLLAWLEIGDKNWIRNRHRTLWLRLVNCRLRLRFIMSFKFAAFPCLKRLNRPKKRKEKKQHRSKTIQIKSTNSISTECEKNHRDLFSSVYLTDTVPQPENHFSRNNLHEPFYCFTRQEILIMKITVNFDGEKEPRSM